MPQSKSQSIFSASSAYNSQAFFYKPGERAAGPLAMHVKSDGWGTNKVLFSASQLSPDGTVRKYLRQDKQTNPTAEVLDDTPNGVLTSFTPTAANPLVPGSVVVTATVGAADVVYTDRHSDGRDPDGTLWSSTDVAKGTVDYFTGDFALNYSTAPDDTTDILLAYAIASLFVDGVGAIILDGFQSEEPIDFGCLADGGSCVGHAFITGEWL